MKIAYTNFTGGEISHSLAARYDLGKFKSSCRHLENMLPDLHGPASKRPGTRFLEDLGGPAVLLPFQFSADPSQNYVLVFQGGGDIPAGDAAAPDEGETAGGTAAGQQKAGSGKLRIAQRDGFVRYDEAAAAAREAERESDPGLPPVAAGQPVELEAPYTDAELYDLSFAQSGDIVYVAHHAHPLHKIMRHGHTDWRIAAVSFTPAINPPGAITTQFSSGYGGSYTLRYKVACVNGKGEVSAPAKGSHSGAKHPSDWVVGDYAILSWYPVEGADSYLVYREEGGTYGLIGVADGSEKTSGGQVVFRDERFAADLKDTPREPRDPFTQDNNPGLVAFHQQRLVLAAPYLEPQTWHASRTGSYEDFSKSRPLKDDDALEFTLASGRIDAIQWIAAFGDLLLGTAGAEYKAIGPDQGTITPSGISVREQSFWGSARLRPLIIGNSVLHVQRQGSRVRDLTYSLEKDGYAGNDLSVLCSHFFTNRLLLQWDYQQAPGSIVYAVRDDGMLLALTYMREHEIWGWSRITTKGKFRSVAVTAGTREDDLYCVVEREVYETPSPDQPVGDRPAGDQPVGDDADAAPRDASAPRPVTKWYLERFVPRWHEEDGIASAFFVDSGLTYQGEPARTLSGLEHLEGCMVSILADGSPQPLQKVAGGCVTLPVAARVACVGLPYRAAMCPQTPEADMEEGATLGRTRAYGTSRIRFDASVGGSYGPGPDTLYDFPQRPAVWGDALQPFTGDMECNPDVGYSPEGEIWFVQDLPLPFTVVAFTLEVDITG